MASETENRSFFLPQKASKTEPKPQISPKTDPNTGLQETPEERKLRIEKKRQAFLDSLPPYKWVPAPPFDPELWEDEIMAYWEKRIEVDYDEWEKELKEREKKLLKKEVDMILSQANEEAKLRAAKKQFKRQGKQLNYEAEQKAQQKEKIKQQLIAMYQKWKPDIDFTNSRLLFQVVPLVSLISGLTGLNSYWNIIKQAKEQKVTDERVKSYAVRVGFRHGLLCAFILSPIALIWVYLKRSSNGNVERSPTFK